MSFRKRNNNNFHFTYVAPSLSSLQIPNLPPNATNWLHTAFTQMLMLPPPPQQQKPPTSRLCHNSIYLQRFVRSLRLQSDSFWFLLYDVGIGEGVQRNMFDKQYGYKIWTKFYQFLITGTLCKGDYGTTTFTTKWFHLLSAACLP